MFLIQHGHGLHQIIPHSLLSCLVPILNNGVTYAFPYAVVDPLNIWIQSK